MFKHMAKSKFDSILDVLNKGLEKPVAHRFSEAPTAKETGVTPCGNYAIDYGVLKVGGIPDGRVVEIFGRESSGKSTLAKYFMREAQKRNKICVLFDTEFADQGMTGQEWAARCGVDIDELIYVELEWAEEILVRAEKAMELGAGLVVIDSVAQMIAKAAATRDPGGGYRTQVASIMSAMIPRICAQAYHAGSTVIFINQLRDLPGVMFGDNFTTPGGRALKFGASIRLLVDKRAGIYENKLPVGAFCRVKTYKNKTATPGLSADIPIYFDGRKFTELDWFLTNALDKGIIIKVNQSTYSYPDKHGELRNYRGWNNVKQIFLMDDDEAERLKQRVLTKGELVSQETAEDDSPTMDLEDDFQGLDLTAGSL